MSNFQSPRILTLSKRQICSNSTRNITNISKISKNTNNNISLSLRKTILPIHTHTRRINTYSSCSITITNNNHSNNYNPKFSNSIHLISKRYRLPNPRLRIGRKQAQNIDFHKERTGTMTNIQKHKSYENLDWTNQDFLDDIPSEQLSNTFAEWNKHWMKNFIQFTNDEFNNFDFYKEVNPSVSFPPTSSSSSSNSSSGSNSNEEETQDFDASVRIDGFSKKLGPENELEAPKEISDSLNYLKNWQNLLKSRKTSFKDDFEVRLPNGTVMTVREYMQRASNAQKSQNALDKGRQLEYPKLDEFGRAYSRGKRKSATAKVLVYPGHGNIYINSVHYSQYFVNYAERLNVCLPLLITDTHRELDVYAVAKGGGTQGRSDAVKGAIARALVRYDPRLRDLLAPYKLLVTDWRKRERKKPGKRGARRQEQWKIR